MLSLARELQEGQHQIVFFNVADRKAFIMSEGFACEVIALNCAPPNSEQQRYASVATLSGLAGLRHSIDLFCKYSRAICDEVPERARSLGISLLLVDQLIPAGAAVAQHLEIPFVTICNSLAVHREPSVPPGFTNWSYGSGWWKRARNRVGYAFFEAMWRPIARTIDPYRRKWKSEPFRNMEDTFSTFAQISQQPPAFDFPYDNLPHCFHYAGPLRRPLREPIEFPWAQLDGRPLIYGSLGTMLNRRPDLFRCFTRACELLDVQLVLSHGGGLRRSQ